MNSEKMIIFLDFDGVMHPVNQLDIFCREEHLHGFAEAEEKTLRAWLQP